MTTPPAKRRHTSPDSGRVARSAASRREPPHPHPSTVTRGLGAAAACLARLRTLVPAAMDDRYSGQSLPWTARQPPARRPSADPARLSLVGLWIRSPVPPEPGARSGNQLAHGTALWACFQAGPPWSALVAAPSVSSRPMSVSSNVSSRCRRRSSWRSGGRPSAGEGPKTPASARRREMRAKGRGRPRTAPRLARPRPAEDGRAFGRSRAIRQWRRW